MSPGNHSANLLAVAIPFAALWAHAPEALTILTGILSAIYYCFLISEKYSAWKSRRKMRESVMNDLAQQKTTKITP